MYKRVMVGFLLGLALLCPASGRAANRTVTVDIGKNNAFTAFNPLMAPEILQLDTLPINTPLSVKQSTLLASDPVVLWKNTIHLANKHRWEAVGVQVGERIYLRVRGEFNPLGQGGKGGGGNAPEWFSHIVDIDMDVDSDRNGKIDGSLKEDQFEEKTPGALVLTGKKSKAKLVIHKIKPKETPVGTVFLKKISGTGDVVVKLKNEILIDSKNNIMKSRDLWKEVSAGELKLDLSGETEGDVVLQVEYASSTLQVDTKYDDKVLLEISDGAVTIEAPERRSDIIPPSVPLKKGNGVAGVTYERDLKITYTADMLGKRVEFSFSSTGGAAGTVVFVENGIERSKITKTAKKSDTLTIRGKAQTTPGSHLHIIAKQNGVMVGRSLDFSVCAHPLGITFKFVKIISTVGVNEWGAKYQTMHTSDSGTPQDLDQVTTSENIATPTATLLFAKATLSNGGFLSAVVLGRVDELIVRSRTGATKLINFLRSKPNNLQSMKISHQFFRFACKRCDIPENGIKGPVVEMSGFKHTFTFAKQGNKFFVVVKKEGLRNPDGQTKVTAGTVDDTGKKFAEIR